MKQRNTLLTFVISAAFAIIILYTRVAFLDFFGGYKNTYIIFYPFMLISALLGGWIAGITSLVIYVFGSAWYLLPPINSLAVENKYDMLGLAIFTVGGILISLICELLLRTRLKMESQNEILKGLSTELHGSKEQLQTILENVADGIVVRNNHGKPIFANRAALELLGIPTRKSKRFLHLKELERQFVITDLQGKRIKLSELPVSKILQGENQSESLLCFKNKKTRQERWFMSRARGIYDKNEKLQFVVAVFADMTERRLIERQKDDFIGIASHELKTPVTALKAYTQALQARFTREGNVRAVDNLQKMDNQISRLAVLISDLLDVTRITSGKLSLQTTEIDLNNLLNEIADEMQQSTQKHAIKREFDSTVIIHADRSRIRQVINNFLTNAIKYSPQANQIILRSKVDKKSVTVSVQDFGVGIAEKNLSKVFKRFYRETGDKAITIPGLGLGLYISSELIKMHNGKIWVESDMRKTKGSTFSFSIPIKYMPNKKTLT